MHPQNNWLLILIFAGALAGAISGWMFGEQMVAIAWLGTLFLDLLKMTIIPLIVAAVITGVASLGDIRKLGRLGGWTVLYYFTTTALAVLTGLIIVNIIQPGSGIDAVTSIPEAAPTPEKIGLTDIILSLVTPNLIDAAANTQLLPIIVFSIIFAIALTTIGERGQIVIGFFDGLNEVMMRIVIWIIYLAPVGIFALIASRLGEAGGGAAFWQEIIAVGWYILTVIIGLCLHFILLFIILHLFTTHGRHYLFTMLRALVTAFGTASSSATLPLTMECASEADLDKRAIKFVLPLGATVNMDGTALYEAVAVMFIAQAYGMHLGVTEQMIVFITATLAAIGAAGIPQAGLVTMVIVLTAVNVPLEGIGLLLAVDWFLDRLRTTVNVWGDSIGAAVISRLIK